MKQTNKTAFMTTQRQSKPKEKDTTSEKATPNVAKRKKRKADETKQAWQLTAPFDVAGVLVT